MASKTLKDLITQGSVPALPDGFVMDTEDDGNTPPLPPGFEVEKPAPVGKHLTYEEGLRLLDREEQAGVSGGFGALSTGFFEGVPIAGPAILSGVQHLGAGTRMLAQGGNYDQNLKEVQDMTKDAQEQHPIATTAGNIAGAVTATAPAVALAPGAFGVGAASLPARMIAGGTTGGLIGGADSGVRSGGNLIEMGKGALIGGAIGAAAPFVGDKAGDLYRSFSTRAAENEAARLAGTNRPAVNVVARAMAADDAVGGTGANIAAAGPRAMMADAGPSTLSVLDTSIQRGGPRAAEASQRITARAAGATDDINAALDAGLGQPQGIVRPLDEIRTASQPARSAAYDGPSGAYAQPIDYASPNGQALEQLIRGRVPPSVIDRANRLMRVNGEESQQILARVADDGSVAFERLPDVRQVDYIKRALDDVSRAGDGNGALGGNTAEGRAYGNLARDIRDRLADAVPEYRTALNTAAEPIAQRQAMQFGQQLLSPAVARDEVETFVAGLPDVDLQALRTGVRSQFDEKLANVARTATDPSVDAREGVKALKDLSSRAAREKLAAIMGQQEADQMLRAVDEAARSFELRAGVATNSRTYARQAAERAVEQANAPGWIETAGSGHPLVSARGVLQALLGTNPQAQLARQDQTWGEIANLLTQPATQGNGTVAQALQRAAAQLPTTDRNTDAIVRALTRGGALSSSPIEQRYLAK